VRVRVRFKVRVRVTMWAGDGHVGLGRSAQPAQPVRPMAKESLWSTIRVKARVRVRLGLGLGLWTNDHDISLSLSLYLYTYMYIYGYLDATGSYGETSDGHMENIVRAIGEPQGKP